jgi:hypothetical protein
MLLFTILAIQTENKNKDFVIGNKKIESSDNK